MAEPSTGIAGNLDVRLVAPRVWRALVADHLTALSPQERRFARSILEAMHDRHVGITPELAADLARLLLDPHAGANAGRAWPAVHRRLNRELSAEDTVQSRRRGTGLLLGSVPTYTVLRLATPIVALACHQIGRCYLFCGDEIQSSVQPQDYADYAQELSTAIVQLARAPDRRGDAEKDEKLCWKDWALGLAGLSHPPAVLRRSCPGLPEMEPSALGLLLDLSPDLPPPSQRSQILPRPSVYRGRKKNPLQREGGIDGVRLSKRETEIEDMLPIEWSYPQLIRLQRIFSDGFLVSEREAKHERARDVLIAVLAPGQLWSALGTDFCKACWFDCVMRFSLLLRQSRLLQSEFRWIEGDRFDRMRTCTFLLQDLPTFQTVVETTPSEPFRHEFLTRLHWLPSYLDTRDHFSSLPDDQRDAANEPESGVVERTGRFEPSLSWARSAWAAQCDHADWLRRETGAPPRRALSGQLQRDEFAFIHIMLLLPTDKAGRSREEVASLLSDLRIRLRLGNDPSRNASVTWVPTSLQNVEAWAFDARQRRESALFTGVQEEVDKDQIAGRLERTWLDQWTKELGHA